MKSAALGELAGGLDGDVLVLAASEPTGAFELAAATAVRSSSRLKPRAASGSGSAAMRTAYFCAPKISTCATPGICEICCGSDRCSAIVVDVGQRQRGRGQRQEQDRLVGRVHLAEARRRRQVGRQAAQRGRDRRLHVERRAVDVAVEVELQRLIEVWPCVEVDVIEVMPAMVENCRSSGAATEAAIVSGLAPGSERRHLMVGKSTRGRAATGSWR